MTHLCLLHLVLSISFPEHHAAMVVSDQAGKGPLSPLSLIPSVFDRVLAEAKEKSVQGYGVLHKFDSDARTTWLASGHREIKITPHCAR